MPTMFEAEKQYPDNAVRTNFVFMGYPYTPPLPQDDYRAVTSELQSELPVRLWYFLDEVTTQEMMRKIWRAILRSDLALFDISGGNPNVALEMGMALAIGRRCIPLLKTNEPNPLGTADLGYTERAEYTSRETLKIKLRDLVKAQSTAMRILNDVSYQIQGEAFPYPREEIVQKLTQIVVHVFRTKKHTTRAGVASVFGNYAQAGIVLDALRLRGVFKLEGQRRWARYLLGDTWVHHDHEVVGA